MTGETTTASVRRFYERFPYPPPGDPGVPRGLPTYLPVVNHYVFGGRRDWTKPFRALVAGGGTGDAVLSLGTALAALGTPAAIDYLDLSRPSREIAERRAAEAGLTAARTLDLSFHTGSLTEAATLGAFDYIDFCGVLNHFPDPAEAFRALSAALVSGGGIGVMAYGELGRTGIYDTQRMLRMIGAGEGHDARLEMAKRLLSDLPKSNRLRRNPRFAHLATAHDNEVADSLLHPADRAFTVPDLAAACRSAGLEIVAFLPPFLYDPLTALRDDTLRRQVAALDYLDRCAFAELLQGSIAKHLFYAVKPPLPASADDLASEPTAVPIAHPPLDLAAGRVTIAMNVEDGHARHVTLTLPDRAAEMAAAIDGRRTVAEIRDATGGDFLALYRPLNRCGLLHLADRSFRHAE